MERGRRAKEPSNGAAKTVQYDGELPLKVNSSLLTVVLHD